ncbi:hypothetical protein Ciccas_011535 [Cichlidogyrus casuarinus]|uniref:RING-type E3 ubiquitin transferase n=1 Tax=Cichlidogyrus casuarinus TaxID=1844966 RepID=A0ABD2PT36_9PLAT
MHTVPMSLFSSFPYPVVNAQGSNGRDLFEILISHLMNSGQNGHPPATDSEIANLSRINLSESQAKEYEKCSVCFDEYSTGDNCIQLVCQHVFHEPCISTWLKRHGTCPVCRKDLQGRLPQNDSEQGATGGDTNSGATPLIFSFGPGMAHF